MPKVAQLKIVSGYNEHAVEQLEILLDKARKGEITEIVSTVKYKDRKYDHFWTGCENIYELVGNMERQKLAMLRRLDPQ